MATTRRKKKKSASGGGVSWSSSPADVVPRPHITTISALEEMLEILKSPESWCQHVSAMNGHGNYVPPCSDGAVKWCLSGALARVTLGAPGVYAVVERLWDKYRREPVYIEGDWYWPNGKRVPYPLQWTAEDGGPIAMSKWNDVLSRTHHEVIEALQAMLQMAKDQQQAAQ